MPSPVCLIIMDGVGKPKDLSRSAVLPNTTPNLIKYEQKYPYTYINASENYVGLSKGQPGSSEVGHLTIGSGRVYMQPLERINQSIQDGDFFDNDQLKFAMENAKHAGKSLHIMGVMSDGGVHAHIDHFVALLQMCKQQKVQRVYIHMFTDGRDTPPQSANKYLQIVEKAIKKYDVGEIATVSGRMYALDRDNNWDRVQKAYDAMVYGKGETATSAKQAITKAYKNGQTDEFILPTVILKDGKPLRTIKKGDSVICIDYRADRERQLYYALSDFNNLSYARKDLNLTLASFTSYDETYKHVHVAFKAVKQKNILSEYLSKQGIKQFKIAETEKYAYITFSFNDGRLKPFKNEDRFLVASPKLPKYDVKPEMSAYQITDKVLEVIKQDKYEVIIINFANGDMVGHSGNKQAAEIAVKVVDECVKKVTDMVLSHGGQTIITADHGNSDIMQYEDGTPHTAHTSNLVPFILVSAKYQKAKLRQNGGLADVAPTLLQLLNLDKPKEMTGQSLIINK